MTIKLIGCVLIIGGTWVFQDGLASIVFYKGRESWVTNHSWRIVRSLLGLVFIIAGCYLVLIGG